MHKILVIEDNEDVRENLCEILELAGYEIDSAENGKLGIGKIRSFKPDLILCDVMMPELDGFGLLKILNRDPLYNHTPLIFLTAKSENTDFRKGMGLGAVDYITKPFDDVALLEAIEFRIKKSKALQVDHATKTEDVRHFFSEAKANANFDSLKLNRESRSYKKDDQVYTEGQQAHWLYYIEEGQVTIQKSNNYGKNLSLDIYQKGDFFGYFPLIENRTYTHNAVAQSNTTLLLIEKDDFSNLLFNDRDFAVKFLKLLSGKEVKKEEKLIDMAYGSVREKVAKALLSLINKDTTTIQMSREELASIAGMAKETLIRSLSEFKKEGLIEITRTEIIVSDASKIATLC